MIVKKMPILTGFPDFEDVKKLSLSRVKLSDFRPLFYDIETTGLSRNSTFSYLIGAVIYETDQWVLYQWMAENGGEEIELLKVFSGFAQNCTCTIQYNGNSFDQPYLEARYRVHHLESPFQSLPSLDLFLSLKPLKSLLKLPRMRQPDLEAFLGLSHRKYCDGGECIGHYKNYCKKRGDADRVIVLGHNEEDMMGLGAIFSCLGYLCLYENDYGIVSVDFDGEKLLLELSLPYALPVAFSNGSQDFYITGKESAVRLMIRGRQGRLRRYYADYKKYDYLPAEDTAIPKVLSACMDKSLRKPARRDTCYTWFPCTDAFLQDPAQQKQYLAHTLSYLLGTL